VKLAVYRQNQFKNFSLFSINSPQFVPLTSTSLFKLENSNIRQPAGSYRKDKKYKLDPVRKYYRGELPSEGSIVELLSNFSNIYTSKNVYSLTNTITYQNRYIINKLVKLFDTGNMLKQYSDSSKLQYLKAALILINKKKRILKNFKNVCQNNISFSNYTKLSTKQVIPLLPFTVDKEPLLKFHLYRVEMPIKAFLQKMNSRKEILKNISNSYEMRKKLKKFVSLKNSKIRNNRIIKSKDHSLRENYKMARRTENAFGLGMFRKSYKNNL
jgi:hypothetical protein